MHHHAYGRSSYGLASALRAQAGRQAEAGNARTIILSRLRGAASQPAIR